MWFFIPLVGFVFGLALGRWRAVLAALPLGTYILIADELEGPLTEWVAFMLTTLLACAIACGVALRRLHRRAHARANPSNG
jgi:peptidoglycan biosynthesis protein MviN/MurJ (putative lipid II flippase)